MRRGKEKRGRRGAESTDGGQREKLRQTEKQLGRVWLQLARLCEGSVSAENRKIRLCFHCCSRRYPCAAATPPPPPNSPRPTTPTLHIIFLSHQVTLADFLSHGEGTLLLLKPAVVAPSCNVPGQDCCQRHSPPHRPSTSPPTPSPERGSFMTGDHHVGSYLHRFWLG